MGKASRAKRERRVTGEGDCYEAAALMLIHMDAKARPSFTLCHGTVIGNAPPVVGVPFGHAWVEVGEVVLDDSNGRSTMTPRARYYERGSIAANAVRRYTWEQAARYMLTTEHFGPWEGIDS